MSKERDKAYAGVFTTALEGGIGYWSVCEEYRWMRPDLTAEERRDGSVDEIQDTVGFRAVVIAEGEEEEFLIDRKVIAHGVGKAWEMVKDGTIANEYHSRAIRDLKFGKWDELDYDADTADLIVQAGLFDEIVYG